MEKINALRSGIVGAAKIAHSFIAGVGASELIDVVAVASREIDKAGRFASQLRVPRTHGSCDALLDDPDIDAVYVPLPNTLHAEWVINPARRRGMANILTALQRSRLRPEVIRTLCLTLSLSRF